MERILTVTFLSPDDVVVLSQESLSGTDEDNPVQFNVTFVNALFAELLKPTEISRDALLSYYVDYYLAQVGNGGFSQFVYNTGWEPEVITIVKQGLTAIGATRHMALFEKGESLVARKPSMLSKFLSGEYFGANKDRDRYDAITKQFYALNESENLHQLNETWLKSRPGLCVVPIAEARGLINLRASAIPDPEARKAEALANAPKYMKLIDALCSAAGQSLDRVTAGDPTNEYEGKKTLAWHFITDKGHHYLVEVDGKAIMIDGTSNQKVVELNTE